LEKPRSFNLVATRGVVRWSGGSACLILDWVERDGSEGAASLGLLASAATVVVVLLVLVEVTGGGIADANSGLLPYGALSTDAVKTGAVAVVAAAGSAVELPVAACVLEPPNIVPVPPRPSVLVPPNRPPVVPPPNVGALVLGCVAVLVPKIPPGLAPPKRLVVAAGAAALAAGCDVAAAPKIPPVEGAPEAANGFAPGTFARNNAFHLTWLTTSTQIQ
jgi:hypothetical protein